MNSVRLLGLAVVSSVVLFTCGGEERTFSSRRATADVVDRRDALSTGVVISQIYGGGGNQMALYNTDYIEIFNRGSTAVNLNGWSVQYAAAAGTSWDLTPLPNVMLQPGQYMLIGEQMMASGVALPVTPDVDDNIAMSATNGKVALVSSTMGLSGACPSGSTVVDIVGYGTANCSESAPAMALTAASVLSRNSNGCTENDNNNTDFAVVVVAPRNTSSTRNVCSGDAGVVDAGGGQVDAGRPDAGGVDAGTGTSDASCTVFATWPTVQTIVGYDEVDEYGYADFYTQQIATADGGMDFISVETYLGFGLTLPETVQFDSMTDFSSCEVCPLMRRRCGATCQKRFMAQSGSATITTVTQDELAGQYVGSLSNVTFREWNFSTDAIVPNGECVTVTSLPINLTWGGPTGGGGGSTGGGGGSTGGGSGGGGGSMGGGSGGGGGSTGGGGGGGGRPPRNDGGMPSDAGTGGGAGGGGGGSATGGGSGTTGGGSAATGGGAAATGGGSAMGGGSGGGGSLKGGTGCSCGTEAELVVPVVMLLGLIRSRRRAKPVDA